MKCPLAVALFALPGWHFGGAEEVCDDGMSLMQKIRGDCGALGACPTILSPPPPIESFLWKFNFQDLQTMTPDGWIADVGDKFGPKSGRSYGWLCGGVNRYTGKRNRGIAGKSDLQNTNVAPNRLRVDSTAYGGCPDENWKVKVPNGQYTVSVTFGDTQAVTDINGCSLQDSVFDGDAIAVGEERTIDRTIDVTDGIDGTDGTITFAGSSLGTSSNEERRCSNINRMTIKTVPSPPLATPLPVGQFPWNFNFQTTDIAEPDGWIADVGGVFGLRNGRSYGWLCGYHANSYTQPKFRDTAGKTDLQNTIVMPDRERDETTGPNGPNGPGWRGFCPDENWKVKVPNGQYTVSVTFGDTQEVTKINGCSLQDSVFDGDTIAVGEERTIDRTIDVIDGIDGTDGTITFAGSRWPSSNRCSNINRMTVAITGCGPAPEVGHATNGVLGDATMAHYDCDNGYTSDGTELGPVDFGIQCQEDNTWSDLVTDTCYLAEGGR